jgi:ribokinase
MITVFGSINIDLVTRVRNLPRPGETVLAATYATLCGGKGANQAVAAARATGGAIPVRMAGAVGDDGFGALSRRNLAEAGIDVTAILTVAAPTGCAFINVDESGENVITVASGANALLTAGALDGIAFGAGDVLVLQMEVPLAEGIKAASVAKAAGGRVIANLAPVPAGLTAWDLDALMSATDVLIVNEHEALTAAAAMGEVSLAVPDAAAMLARRYARTIVATLGAAGACAALADGSKIPATAPRITPVDTTGAGDTFVGVLAAVLGEGRGMPEAMTLACKAASLACLKLGAQEAMPDRASILG